MNQIRRLCEKGNLDRRLARYRQAGPTAEIVGGLRGRDDIGGLHPLDGGARGEKVRFLHWEILEPRGGKLRTC